MQKEHTFFSSFLTVDFDISNKFQKRKSKTNNFFSSDNPITLIRNCDSKPLSPPFLFITRRGSPIADILNFANLTNKIAVKF